ncbi:MAG TPA: divalent-cation tolerance protein CutA [Rhodospirillaceae bacterium]|nr:divalent-cation tolerance protein CutA [Rhodospirillaceae bacterium]
MSAEYALIYITAANEQQAMQIGNALVAERLAGCVNIIPHMQSIYRWDGTIQQGKEALLIAKTRADKVHDLNARVRSLHSYDMPAILAIPLLHVDADFAKWLDENLG